MKRYILILIPAIMLSLVAKAAEIAEPAQEITVPVNIGYNGIGFSVTPLNLPAEYAASSLLSDLAAQGITAGEIGQWNGDGWSIYTNGVPGTDFPLDRDKGFYIKAVSENYHAGTWVTRGMPVALPKNIQLNQGWNSVTIPATLGLNTAALVIEDINAHGGSADVMMRWDGGRWVSTDKDIPETDQEIVYGMSYFIRCAGASVWELQKHDVTPPAEPVCEAVQTPTSETSIALTGTKDRDSSVIINGIQKVLIDESTVWAANVTLTEGANTLNITSKDCSGNESAACVVEIFVDTTPPVLPAVTDDGVTTKDMSSLHFTWSADDLESGVEGYSYALGTTAGGNDVLDWTPGLSSSTEATISGMSFQSGKTYYCGVKAKNKAGLWSSVGSSDGITVSQSAPVISEAVPSDGAVYSIGDVVEIGITASDTEGDEIFYMILLDGQVVSGWDAAHDYEWQTFDRTTGLHNVEVRVKDIWGNESSRSCEVFFVRQAMDMPVMSGR